VSKIHVVHELSVAIEFQLVTVESHRPMAVTVVWFFGPGM